LCLSGPKPLVTANIRHVIAYIRPATAPYQRRTASGSIMGTTLELLIYIDR